MGGLPLFFGVRGHSITARLLQCSPLVGVADILPILLLAFLVNVSLTFLHFVPKSFVVYADVLF